MKYILLVLFILAGCVQKPVTTTPPAPPTSGDFYWTGKGDWKPAWDDIALNALQTNAPNILKASDMESACPNYPKMTDADKRRVFVQLIAGIISYESDFSLTEYSVEPASAFPDKDIITGRPVASEGLLQLSYQDQDSYRNTFGPGICVFNWAGDKDLGNRSPDKSIFDPQKNLSCGIAILDLQVKQHGIVFYNTSYWSTLRPNGKYGQVPGIKAIVKSLKGCS